MIFKQDGQLTKTTMSLVLDSTAWVIGREMISSQ